MTNHDELLKRRGIRFGTVLHDGEHQQIWYEDKPLFGPDEWDNNEVAIAGFCAAIRELQADLEAASGPTPAGDAIYWHNRATAAEARLKWSYDTTMRQMVKPCMTFEEWKHQIDVALEPAATQDVRLDQTQGAQPADGDSTAVRAEVLPAPAAATNRRVRRLDRRAEPCPKIQLETPTAESLRLEGMEEAAKFLERNLMAGARAIRAEIARRKAK